MAQKGDFIGFTFNGTHSSDLGIVRTSNGSRYNQNLLPSSSDQTVAVPGGDGVYFFGTNYQTRVFQLQIASDEITEMRMRQIQLVWGDKQIHELIFDEAPYKVYMAKCTNMPQFNFICFDENGGRIYKGEGSVEFTCYYPYAKSRYKFLDQYMRQMILSVEPSDWPINYFKMIDNQYIMIYPGTTFVAGTYYKSIPEWYGGEFALGDGIFHNHYLLGNGIDIIFEDVYTEWTPVGETEEEREIDWEAHKNELYIKDENNYIKLLEEAEYDDEEQYYTYEVSHEQVNPHEEYSGSTISLINIDDWKDTSGMLDTQEGTVVVDTPYPTAVGEVDNAAIIYNPGDIEADFQVWITPTQGATTTSIILYHNNTPVMNGQLNIKPITFVANSDETMIQYDSRTELLTGYEDVLTPGTHLYNKYIKSGDFFKIPVTYDHKTNTKDTTYRIVISGGRLEKIEYNYLYY